MPQNINERDQMTVFSLPSLYFNILEFSFDSPCCSTRLYAVLCVPLSDFSFFLFFFRSVIFS